MKSAHNQKLWSTRFVEHEPVRFLLAGGLNTTTSYTAYLRLLPLIGYAAACSLAYIGGVFFGYYLSARFVFRRPLRWRQAFQYPLVYVLQYALGITLMTAFIEGLQGRAEYVPALVIVITIPLTFWLSRWVINATSGLSREKCHALTGQPASKRSAASRIYRVTPTAPRARRRPVPQGRGCALPFPYGRKERKASITRVTASADR
jgi:putative flippase GtrA